MSKSSSPPVAGSQKAKAVSAAGNHSDIAPAGKSFSPLPSGKTGPGVAAEQRKNDEYVQSLLEFLKTTISHAC